MILYIERFFGLQVRDSREKKTASTSDYTETDYQGKKQCTGLTIRPFTIRPHFYLFLINLSNKKRSTERL